jgi:hypothetical protein
LPGSTSRSRPPVINKAGGAPGETWKIGCVSGRSVPPKITLGFSSRNGINS